MQLDIAKLTDTVTKQKTVVDGVVTTLNALNRQISDLSRQLAAAIEAEDPAAIAQVQKDLDVLNAELEDNTAALSGAIIAGTPVGPRPAPTPDDLPQAAPETPPADPLA